MRRVIVWCLLALLPWRLWAADAMALQHAGHAPMAAASIVHAAGAGPHVQPPAHAADTRGDATPCHGAAVHPDAQADPTGADTSHVGCTACDLCHNPLAVTLAAVAWPPATTGGWRASTPTSPATHVPPPPRKPPIA